MKWKRWYEGLTDRLIALLLWCEKHFGPISKRPLLSPIGKLLKERKDYLMYPYLNAETSPFTKTGRLATATMQGLLNDINELRKRDQSNAPFHFQYEMPTMIVQPDHTGRQQFPWLGQYAERSGTGCCGVPVILKLGLLNYKRVKNPEYDRSRSQSSQPNVPLYLSEGESWKTLRRRIAELMMFIELSSAGYSSMGKLWMAALTEGQVQDNPHLLDILDFLEFEITNEFRNSSSLNQITLFTRAQPVGMLVKRNNANGKPANDAATRRMRQRAIDRINGK